MHAESVPLYPNCWATPSGSIARVRIKNRRCASAHLRLLSGDAFSVLCHMRYYCPNSCNKKLLFEYLLEAGVQGFATKRTVGDLALRVDKDVIGDGINHIS